MPLSRWMQVAPVSLVVVAAGVGIALLPGSPIRRGPVAVETTNMQPAPEAPVAEQPPPFAPLPVEREAMGYTLLLLLNDAHVQRELDLTREQRQSIDELTYDYLEEHARLDRVLAAGASGESADRNVRQEETTRERRGRLLAHGAEAVALLSPDQRQRLDEVIFQLKSIDIYQKPEFVAALKLSNEQRRQIGQVFATTAATMKQLRLSLDAKVVGRTAYEDEVHARLMAADRQIDALLTGEQMKLVTGWRGAPIPFGRMHLRLKIGGGPIMARN